MFITVVIAIGLAAWPLWMIAGMVEYATQVANTAVRFLIGALFYSLSALVTAPFKIQWRHPPQDIILRVVEVLVWAFVVFGFLFTMRPEVLIVTRRTLEIRDPQRLLLAITPRAPLTEYATTPPPPVNPPSRQPTPIGIPSSPGPSAAFDTGVHQRSPEEQVLRGMRSLPDIPVDNRHGVQLRDHVRHTHTRQVHSFHENIAYESVDGHEPLPTYMPWEDAPPPFRSVAGTIRR